MCSKQALLRLLWLNWRDIKNPEAGGAEVFTHEIMKRLAKLGYSMTLFTTKFPGGLKNEWIDEVNIIREGGKYTVYSKARSYYNSHKEHYDIVVDEINTRPFLTTKYVKKKPIVAIFHQLAGEFWFYETHFPLNYIGYYYLEKKWLSYYKDIPTVTVSKSSKDDLEAIGFRKVLMVTEGVNVTPLQELCEKEPSPTVAFVGRLRKAKMPDHAIRAFSIIKKEIPDAKMWVIGGGYMRKELETKFDIRDITFFGSVTDELKYKLLGKAHLVLVPSAREGWGLVVVESNAMGTPVIAYNVPGLRDSVRDRETGLLADENSPDSLAHSAIYLLKNTDFLTRLSTNALTYSRQFNWDYTANEFDQIIKDIVSKSPL
jgi:glycosyltransferase involved in cell wall biosynthesis